MSEPEKDAVARNHPGYVRHLVELPRPGRPSEEEPFGSMEPVDQPDLEGVQCSGCGRTVWAKPGAIAFRKCETCYPWPEKAKTITIERRGDPGHLSGCIAPIRAPVFARREKFEARVSGILVRAAGKGGA